MISNNNIKKLDVMVTSYIATNSPKGPEGASTILMRKRQLRDFYTNMTNALMSRENKKSMKSGSKLNANTVKKKTPTFVENKENCINWTHVKKQSMESMPLMCCDENQLCFKRKVEENLHPEVPSPKIYKRVHKQSIELNDFAVETEWTDMVKENIPLPQQSKSEMNKTKNNSGEVVRSNVRKNTLQQKDKKIEMYIRDFEEEHDLEQLVRNRGESCKEILNVEARIQKEHNYGCVKCTCFKDKYKVNPRWKNPSENNFKQEIKRKISNYLQKKNRYIPYL